METTVDTVKMKAIIEMKSFSGSAFAVNSEGEQIFINNRIMERMKLNEGSQINAYVLPNYEDKRFTIPWRAMRVDVPRDIPQQPAPDVRKYSDAGESLDNTIMRELWDKSNTLGQLWSSEEIAEVVAAPVADVRDACVRLHDRGVICRVDFSSDPTKIKTIVMWTADIRDFED
tara:strand:+ start:48 stop:566 length:519 start_codon:yes stop_codon:yes gene_type:complete